MPTAHRDPTEPDLESTAGDSTDNDNDNGNAGPQPAGLGVGNHDHDDDDSGSSVYSSDGGLGEMETPRMMAPFPLRRMPTEPPKGFHTRVMRKEEIAHVAQICVDAFGEQNKQTGLIDEFPEGPPVDFFAYSHDHPDIATVVVVDPEGKLAATSTIDLRDGVAGIGPVAVAPQWWNKKLGRFVMNGALEQAHRRDIQCTMLQQVTNNVKSFALYARMEFVPIASCLSLEGFVFEHLEPSPEYDFRRLAPEDVGACDALYQQMFPGFSRKHETRDAIEEGLKDESVTTFGLFAKAAAGVDEGEERLVAFTTGLDLHGFVLAEDREAYKSLLIHSSNHLRRQGSNKTNSGGVAFHLLGEIYPDLLDWVFNEARLYAMEMTTLMAKGGPYPQVSPGSTMVYSPSVLY